jgi:hypothetical protein
VNRPGVTLRWREGYLGWPARGEFPLLVDETAPLDRAMQSPFAANPVGIRMTVLPMENGLLGPTVHVLVRVNQRDLPAIHDLAGRCRTAMRLRLAAWRDDGLAVQPLERELPIEIDEAEYASRADAGFGLAFLVRLPGPGVWQVRAVVADGLGARTGGDTRFVQVPKPRQGWLSLSGLILYRGESQKTISPEVLLGDPAVRLFEQGDAVTFKYEVLDPVLGSGGDSTVETRARLFAGGREVLDTGNAEVSFGPAHLDAHRTVAGRLQLNRTLAKGVYVLQVAVRDLKAPAGDSRTAMQTIDFEVRE